MEKDPNGLDPTEAGAKLDTGKAPVFRGVIKYFPKSIKQVALLSQFGAEKYSWHGWSAVDDCINRYTDAMLRHLVDEEEGPLDDGPGGSGLLHATAVAWNALARLEKIIEELENGYNNECEVAVLREKRRVDSLHMKINEISEENNSLRDALEMIADEYSNDTWVGSIAREGLDNLNREEDEPTVS